MTKQKKPNQIAARNSHGRLNFAAFGLLFVPFTFDAGAHPAVRELIRWASMRVLRSIYCFSALLALCLAGCCTVVRSEADLFFRHHPELRSHYTRLSPTDADSLKERADSRFSTWRYAIDAINTRQPDQVVINENERRLQMVTASHEEDIKIAQELERAVTTTGGQMYFYEFRDGAESEEGYFVLHNGRIVTKAGVLKGKQYD